MVGEMEDKKPKDPFDWDVEAVALLLGAGSRPWTKDPASLVAKIEEEEIDGKTLLTFELTCSRQELMECLGIKLARQKSALVEAIVDLRSRSRGFQQWKQSFLQKQSGYQEDVLTPVSNGHEPNPAPTQPATRPELVSEPAPHQESSTSVKHGAELPIRVPDLPIPNPREPQLESSAEQPLIAESDPREPAQDAEDPALGEPDQDRPLKRKRIAPVFVSDVPLERSVVFIPTEADIISARLSNGDLPWESASKDAYLGEGRLPEDDVLSSTAVLSSRVIEPEKDAFATLLPNTLPHGRRLTVHRVTKRFLVRNGRRERRRRDGIARSPSPDLSDTDPILDFSNMPDILDPQTLAEMEAERLESDRRKAVADQVLTNERVQEILDEAIRSMTTNWEEVKLPRYQRKAHFLWIKARRQGTKMLQILNARKQAKHYDERIKKMCAEIKKDKWKKIPDVENMAKCLDQTVEDRLYQLWLANMLESRTEPPKPQGMPKNKRPVVRVLEELVDEEVLTSSDEDDFIEFDDEPGLAKVDLMDIDSPSNGKDGFIKKELIEPLYMDLTQTTTPESVAKSNAKRIFIDLTSPHGSQEASKSHSQRTIADAPGAGSSAVALHNSAPAVESLGSFDEIGALNPHQLARDNDRWRLVICMIWNLPHIRRKALLSFIHEKHPDDAWEQSVRSYISNPISNLANPELEPTRLVALDLTRTFLSLVKCRHYKADKMTSLKQRRRNDIEKARHTWFVPFCEFIERHASHFPQDSQIYTGEPADDQLGRDVDDMGDEMGDDQAEAETPSKGKAPVKEIIQNRAAVDLRERERQRQQEQDTRRKQLRAQMVHSMPENKARLIINESKQENQAFIYFNEDIGKRIMDHQIDGVRFMWNEIVLDARTRQGCLLAHTMGLGKTMQVITLLVAIAEAAKSQDPSVLVQIPEDLRRSQTLILCPPSLIDNWMDELLTWAPKGLLGSLLKIDSNIVQEERLSIVQEWSNESGVLVIGHEMFKKVMSAHEEAEDLLLNRASIVVVDEAHKMKNPTTSLHQAAIRFKTKTRIALTGSPLANNVEEYYQMINWVAPNFLGPLEEFKTIYANPIQRGLWGDSIGSEKRLALKKLEALKRTVGPKINRATIKMVKKDLPSKQEFVISVVPTPLQSRLYALYIDGLLRKHATGLQQGQLFAVSNHLALICNHPSCFGRKVKEIDGKIKRDDGDLSWFPQDIIQPALRELNQPDPFVKTLSRKSELLTLILDEARKVGDKVLVFSQSLLTISYLEELCRGQRRQYSVLSGTTAVTTRQDSVKSFNTGDKEVYLISTRAGGVGLNIQGANRVVVFDFQWNPVDVQQAVGRAYRLGQTKQTYVYQFVVAGTFEENLHNQHVFKMQLSSRVVDKTNPLSWSKRHGRIVHHIETKPPADLKRFLGKDQILDRLISFRQGGEAIQAIVSTDTFEEEDLDAKLTVDETREVDEEVRQNQLRTTDPEEYRRQRDKREAERHRAQIALIEQARARVQPQSTPVAAPLPAHSLVEPAAEVPGGTDSANTNTDARIQSPSQVTTDDPPPATGPASQHPQHTDSSLPSTTSTSAPAPLPLAGANTYFGESRPHDPPPPSSSAVPRTPTLGNAEQNTPVNRGGFFDSSKNTAKIEFETRLRNRIQVLQSAGQPGIGGDPEEIASNFTEAVHKIRKEKSYGFLPDNQHWRVLEGLLQHDRFVVAMVSGHLTASYVALGTMDTLKARIDIFNGLSEQEFATLSGRETGVLDPSV